MRSIKEDEDYRLASIEDEKRRQYPERYPTITGSGVLLEKLIDKAAVVQPKTAKYKVGPSKNQKVVEPPCWKGLYTKLILLLFSLLIIGGIVVGICGFKIDKC